MQHADVIIIGAGAAGLMCAAKAAARGRQVVVFDHANKAGKKILMSGGGRCNFTNYHISFDRYLCHNPHFFKSALKRYTQWDFISLVEKYGIAYHEKKDGQLFCDTKASAILNMLLDECKANNVDIRLKHSIHSIQKADSELSRYQLIANGNPWQCQSLVIATGGPSIPTLGASGFGYEIAKQFNLPVYEPVAGLVPFVITGAQKQLCESLSGTALKVEVSCGKTSFIDDMLFTHRGLSGPAMLQISSYWHLGDTLRINLLPTLRVGQILRNEQHQRPKMLLRNWLAELTTQKFAEFWLASNAWKDKTLAQLNGTAMDEIAESLQNWTVKPAGTEGYRTAEVALGGVDTNALSSKTLEAKEHAGLYFIGEVVDVAGHLGGFNFQWAWSSAVAAAESV